MSNRTPDDQREFEEIENREADKLELDQIQEELDQARAASADRAERVTELTGRFRELRRKNHFRLMLEDLFKDKD